MSDVCFSGSALVLLTAIAGIIGSVITALFWGWINTLKDNVKEARAERDRAADNLESALNIGEVTAGKRRAPPSGRR